MCVCRWAGGGALSTAVAAVALDGDGGRWRALTLLAAVPLWLLTVGFWWLPESPRWLLRVGRVDDARRLLRRAARCGGAASAAELARLDAMIAQLSATTAGVAGGSAATDDGEGGGDDDAAHGVEVDATNSGAFGNGGGEGGVRVCMCMVMMYLHGFCVYFV